MKKLLFSVAILAVAASCSKNEVVEMPQSNAIGFSTLNDRVVSKAANDGNADFRVFADNGGADWMIDDYVVNTTTIDGTAEAPAEGPYYWPTDASAITFYAYAPYDSDGTNTVDPTESFTNGAGSLSLAYTVPAGAQEDFTVATPVPYNPSAEVDAVAYPETGVVPFVFQHMLAKITVNVDLETEFSKTNTLASTAHTATFTATNVNKLVVDATGVAATTYSLVVTNNDNVYSGKLSYYIAPQNFAGCILQLNDILVQQTNSEKAVFSGDMSEIVLDGSELSGSGTVDAFAAGNHYIFNVFISGTSTDDDGNKVLEVKFTANNATWADNPDSDGTDIDQE